MNMIENLELITASRLRADAASAWADSHLSWREQRVGFFYPSIEQAEDALMLIVAELSRRNVQVSPLSRTQAEAIVDLEISVGGLIGRIIQFIVSHQSSQIAEPLHRSYKLPVEASSSGSILSEGIVDRHNEAAFTTVRVFYGTDRSGKIDTQRGYTYSHERSSEGIVDYGECIATIPKRHRVGKWSARSFVPLDELV